MVLQLNCWWERTYYLNWDIFVQASEDDHDLDMLASGSEIALECQSIQQRDESSKERCDDIHTTESNVEDNVHNSK